MTLVRVASWWTVIGAVVGCVSAIVVQAGSAAFGIGFAPLAAVLSVVTVAASAAGGAAVGWGLNRADSRGKGCLAPFFGLLVAVALLSVLIPFLVGDLVTHASAAALEEARRRGPGLWRDRAIGTGDVLSAGAAIGRAISVTLVAPLVALPSVIIAPIAALFASRGRSQ